MKEIYFPIIFAILLILSLLRKKYLIESILKLKKGNKLMFEKLNLVNLVNFSYFVELWIS